MTLNQRRQNMISRLDAGKVGMHKCVTHTDNELTLKLTDVLLFHGRARSKNEAAGSLMAIFQFFILFPNHTFFSVRQCISGLLVAFYFCHKLPDSRGSQPLLDKLLALTHPY